MWDRRVNKCEWGMEQNSQVTRVCDLNFKDFPEADAIKSQLFIKNV